MRVFVCVGSRSYPFDRLFKELDRVVASGAIESTVFAQIGSSAYEPKNFAWERFMNSQTFNARMTEADIVVSHGASGSIMGALSAGKKVVVVARLARYGEHINDHQVGINETLASEGLVLNVAAMDDLGPAIRRLETGEIKLKPWRNENPNAIVDAIDEFIQENVL